MRLRRRTEAASEAEPLRRAETEPPRRAEEPTRGAEEPPRSVQREPRRRAFRTRNAGAAAVGTAGAGVLLLARLVMAAASVIALLIALAIVLRDVDANGANTIVKGIHEGANFFAGAFTGLDPLQRSSQARDHDRLGHRAARVSDRRGQSCPT